MEGTSRDQSSTGLPNKGFLFSPSLIKRVENASAPLVTSKSYYNIPHSPQPYLNSSKHNLSLQARNQSPQDWDMPWKNQNDFHFSGHAVNEAQGNWDPNWKILSSERPPSHYKREYMTDLLSMRPKDLKEYNDSHIENLVIRNNPKSERSYHESDMQNSSNISTYGNAKAHSGSYAHNFTQGEPYLPINKMMTYSNNKGNCNAEQFQKFHTSQAKLSYSSKTQGPSRSFSPSKKMHSGATQKPISSYKSISNLRYDPALPKTSKTILSPKRIYGGLPAQSTMYSENTIEPIRDQKRYQNEPLDKLALLRRRLDLSNVDPQELNHSSKINGTYCARTTPTRSERRRSQSVVPIHTGWTQKIINHSQDVSNTIQSCKPYTHHDSDDNASVHNYLKRDTNYKSSKDKNEVLTYDDYANNIPTPSYISNHTVGSCCDKSEDETKSCHNLYKAHLRATSPAKKFPRNNLPTPTSTTQRRNLSENKTNYVDTEELKDFTSPPNNKWLEELVNRLKASLNEWNMNLEALLDTRRLAKFYPSLIFHMNPTSHNSATFNPLNLRIVTTEVIKLLNSPRSSLAKSAALCLIDLYYFGGKKMDQVNDDIVPACLKKSSQHSSDFLSEAAYCVLVQMCRHVTPTKALSSIIHATQASRHQGFRTVGVKCIAVIINRLKGMIVKAREFSSVLDLLKTTVREASPEIRSVSKIAICLLMRYIGDKSHELLDIGHMTESDISEFEMASSKVEESQIDLILNPYQHTHIFSSSTKNINSSIYTGTKKRL